MPQGRLLVVEKGAGTLGVIDLESGLRVGGVAASGVVPHEVAASADGATAILPVYSDSGVGRPGTDGQTVDVVDLRDLRVLRTVDLGSPSRPHDAALTTDGRIVITAEIRRELLILDPATGELVGSAPTGGDQSHMVVLARDGARAYTVEVGPGSISVIDLERSALIRVVELGTRVNRIALTADERFVVTADQTSPRLAIIDTGDFSVSWMPIPAIGYGSATTEDGRVLLGLLGSDQVAVIDLASRRVERLIRVRETPQRIVVQDGLAYISCDRSDVVVEVDPTAGTVLREFATGAGPDGLTWAPEPA